MWRWASLTLSATLAAATGSIPSGQLDQHAVGERHRQLVRHRATPVSARDPEAVHRDRRHRQAVRGVARPAGCAGSAADLERDDDAIADRDGADPLADRQDVRDAFVAEAEGHRERRRAEADRPVHVAGGDRDRADGCGVRPRWRRSGDRAPAHAAAGRCDQSSHLRAGRPDSLPGAIARGTAEAAEPDVGVALEGDPGRRHRIGAEQMAQVPSPAFDQVDRSRHRPTIAIPDSARRRPGAVMRPVAGPGAWS